MPFSRKNIAQGYFAAKTGNYNLYLRPVPKYKVQSQSFTNCSNVIYQSGHELGSLRWEIGDSPIRYRINKS